MKNLGILYAFLGGAVVGCAAALLFAPEKGSELRAKIKETLKKHGVNFTESEVDEIVEQIQ